MMLKMSRHGVVSMFLVILQLFTLFEIGVSATAYKYEKEALLLHNMGILDGINPTKFDPDLGSPLNRTTGIAMVVKIMGEKLFSEKMSISDANKKLEKYTDKAELKQDWQKKYVGYAINKGWVRGISENTLSPMSGFSGKQLAKLLLINLKYDEDVDFSFDNSLKKLNQVGGISSEQIKEFDKDLLIRNDMVGMCYSALSAKMKVGTTLKEMLISKDVIKTTSSPGVSPTQISTPRPTTSVNYAELTAPTGVTITPVGGTVLPNTLNSTNTNLTATATITAGQATGGYAQLLIGGVVKLTDNTILATDTSVSFSAGAISNAQLQTAIPEGGVVTVKLFDSEGISVTSSVRNPTLTVIYSSTLKAPTGVTITPVGGTVVENALNSTNTDMTATATITAGQATGGYAQLLIGGVVKLTDSTILRTDTTVSFSAGSTTNSQLQTAIPSGGDVTVKLFDEAGSSVTSSVSNPTLTAIYSSTVTAPTGLTLTPVGETVVANALNSTNTNMTATATITAGQATGGYAQLLIGGVVKLTDSTIRKTDTTVSFSAGTTSNAKLQTAIPSGGVVTVKVFDAAGNSVTSSVGNPTLTVLYSATLTAPTGLTVTPVGGTVVANALNTTNTNITALATITAGQATGGYAQLLIGGVVKLTDSTILATDTSMSFSAGATTNAQLQTAIPSGGVVTVKLFDAAGNSVTSSVSNPTLTVIYAAKLTAATKVTITPVGGTVFANALNSTNTNITATATITAGQATGGYAQLIVGGVVKLTDSTILGTDTTVAFGTSDGTPTNAELQTAIATGGIVTVKLFDSSGNSVTSSVGNPTLTVNYSAPTAPTTVTVTPVGGTVVANALNSTNTNMTVTATITAGQATGGYAQLLIGGVVKLTDSTILATDTSVSFSVGTTTNAQLKTAIPSGEVVTVKLFDAAGNSVTSSVGNPKLTVIYAAKLTAATKATITPVGGTVVANALNSTNSNMTSTATITAGQTTGGYAQLLIGGVVKLTDSTILATDTSVTFDAGATTNAGLKTAIPSGGVVTVKLFDAVGNSVTSSVGNPTLTVNYNAPTAPTIVTVTAVGGTVVANTLNSTNTNMTATATITAGQATGGYAQLLIDGVVKLTDNTILATDTSVSFDAGAKTNAQLQTAIPSGGVVTVKLFDSAGNSVTSSVGNPTLIVNYATPKAPEGVTITPVDGTVVANVLNSTNTNMTAASTITAGQVTGGYAQLLIGGVVKLTDSTILATDTSVSFSAGSTTNAQLQTAIPAGGVVTVKLFDLAGNSVTSTVGNPTLKVDYTEPTAPISVTITPVGGTIVANALNTTNTNMTATAKITAGQATGGYAQLLIGGVVKLTDSTILANDTTVTFNAVAKTNVQLQTAIPSGEVVMVKLFDSAGNSVTSSVGNPTLIVNYATPTAPEGVTITPVDGTIVDNALNSTNTNMTAASTITAGQVTGGYAQLLIGGVVKLTDSTILATDTTVTFDAGATTNEQLKTAIPSGGVVTVKLFDAAGNSVNSSVGNPTLIVDYTAPTAPTVVKVTPLGGTIVANTLNTTNTNMTATATITAGQATGGYAELLIDDVVQLTDSTILATDRSVAFSAEATTNEQLQTAIPSGGVVTVKLFDATGNSVTSAVSNPTLTVDYT